MLLTTKITIKFSVQQFKIILFDILILKEKIFEVKNKLRIFKLSNISIICLTLFIKLWNNIKLKFLFFYLFNNKYINLIFFFLKNQL